MNTVGLDIRKEGALDFVSVGALVHRLDTGVIPFRKATECLIHVIDTTDIVWSVKIFNAKHFLHLFHAFIGQGDTSAFLV